MAMKASTLYKSALLPALVEFIAQTIFTFTHTSTANTITVVTEPSVNSNALLPATNDGLTVAALASGLGHIRYLYLCVTY